MLKHTSKILKNLLQDFYSVSDHLGTLCVRHAEYENATKKNLPNDLTERSFNKCSRKNMLYFSYNFDKKKEDFTARGLTIFHNLWKNTSQKETFMYDKCCYLNSKLVSVIILGFEIHLKQFSTSFSTTYLTSSNRLAFMSLWY